MRQNHVWSVTELNRWIKHVLEQDERLSDVWVRGEISNFVHHSSGHMYFTLKDRDAKIKIVMFASYNRFLKFIPKDGTKALVRGSISAFERDGTYQLYAREMQPDGLGSLYLAFEQLKAKLEAEGLFAPERKRPLPLFPKRVGVVTSPTGAAIRDICTTIKRRFPQTEIVISPALVQGVDAPSSIVAAIGVLTRQTDIDVLIVGRGGGSIEELWAFNEEMVARAIAASPVPVISAVGHETDFTIADFVADVRAATPTAAAELAVPHYLEWLERVKQLDLRMHRALRGMVDEERKRLTNLQHAYAMRQPRRRLEEAQQRLDDWQSRLRQAIAQLHIRRKEQFQHASERIRRFRLSDRIEAKREHLMRMQERLQKRMEQRISLARTEWLSRMAQLDALSPLRVMERGYSLVYKDDQLIKSIEQFAVGDRLMVRLSDGRISAHVTELAREEKADGSQKNRTASTDAV
jgi:exodeoxyribonuclease VII large subunit